MRKGADVHVEPEDGLAVSRLRVVGALGGALFGHVGERLLGAQVVELEGVVAHNLTQRVLGVRLDASLRTFRVWVQNGESIVVPVGEFTTVYLKPTNTV